MKFKKLSIGLICLIVISWVIISATTVKSSANGSKITAFVLLNPLFEPTLPDYTHHFANFKVVMDLLRNNFKVYWVAKGEEVSTLCIKTGEIKEVKLNRGDFIIPIKKNYSKERLSYLFSMLDLASKRNAIVKGLTESVTLRVIPLNYPKILVSAQSWASCGWWYYDCLLEGEVPWDHIYQEDGKYIDPAKHNLIIEHGGWGIVPEEYNKALRRFVKEGGNYIGSCWGAMMSVYRESYPSDPAKKGDFPFCVTINGRRGYITGEKTFTPKGYNVGSGIADAWDDATWNFYGRQSKSRNVTKHDTSVLWASPLAGQGPVILKNEEPDHPVMWGLPPYFENIYWNGPVMKVGKYAKALATFRNVVEERYHFNANYPPEIWDPKDPRYLKVYELNHDWSTKEGVETWRDILTDAGKALYVASQRPGEGKVMVYGCHPEASNSMNPFGKYDSGYYVIYKSILWTTSGSKTQIRIAKAISLDDIEKKSSKVKVETKKEIEMRNIKNKAQEGINYITSLLRKRNLDRQSNAGYYLIYTRDILKMINEYADYFENWYDEAERIGTSKAMELVRTIDSWKKETESILTTMLSKLKKVTPKNVMDPLYDWQYLSLIHI